MRTLIIFVLVSSILGSSSAFALSSVATIIKQADVPVAIVSYDADYEKGDRFQPAGIVHKIKYKNTGKQKIEAISFGLVSFDAWNDFLDTTYGYSTNDNDPGDSESYSWITTCYASASFRAGFAYVNKIRFADGRVWRVNKEEIRDELRKIQADFDLKNLDHGLKPK